MSDLMDKIIAEAERVSAERQKSGVTPQDFLKNWLGDFAASVKQHELIDQEFERLKALPGIFCCYCGVKIFTDLTPLQYMAAESLPPACDKCDRPAGTI